MNKRAPAEEGGQPKWIRNTITGLGMAIVGHEAFVYDGTVRWPLLLVALVMMGLMNVDKLDRYLPSPRSDPPGKDTS